MNRKTRNIFFVSFLALVMSFAIQCNDDCINGDRCSLEPNGGPCNAYFPKFYFDMKEKRCKEFIWGGCAGVVPFETLEDCEKQCSCK